MRKPFAVPHSLATGFRDVDTLADPQPIVHCLSVLDDLPDVQAYKERSIDALQLRPDSRVADVGCGLGFDLIRLHRRVSAGRVVGFDSSLALVIAARRTVAGLPGVAVRQADAHHLDQPDGSFDAIRIDRSLQHIADPGRVIAEMARLARSGGLVAASEPDWQTFYLTSGDQETTRRLTADWVAGFRNPVIGRDLVDRLADAHLVICDHAVDTLVVSSFATAAVVFDLAETMARAVRTGTIGKAAADAMTADLTARSTAGRFYARLCIHTVVGRKP